MIYKFKWVQPYYGWIEWKEQEIEKQLSCGDFSEATLVLEKVMSL